MVASRNSSGFDFDTAETIEHKTGVAAVFRPIQYLGSKLRALDAIIAAASTITPRPNKVLDLFSGSSVVSQAFAHAGFHVTATDALSFNVIFARALMSIARPQVASLDKCLDELQPPVRPTVAQLSLEPLFSQERDALISRDSDILFRISRHVPQIWRPEHASVFQRTQYENLEKARGLTAFAQANLISTHYAGTYFGLAQSVEIDRIRVGIEKLRLSGFASQWEGDVLLTALLSVASDCVFSAGKHFAQFHRIDDSKEMSFLQRRILQDRTIDVWDTFVKKVDTIVKYALPENREHCAFHTTLEEILEDRKTCNTNLIYADPPYTAQQYSRFYHVPEVIATYCVPHLQSHRGAFTQGLYPERRYLSPFCSKRQAPSAFQGLFHLADRSAAHLILSYSGSSSGVTGNDRMISLENLLQICRDWSGIYQTELVELEHKYRQFNQSDSAILGRSDKEFLIICKRTC